ncbi:hypothetical protein CIB48_g1149 [Xylaria polymorpha]|nr:hypothetical protein CIB48_g1149 [Xylaria polymorpha]
MASSTAEQFLSTKSAVNYAGEEKNFTIWDADRETSKRLFLTENCTLEIVKRRMETEHSFPKFALLDYQTILRDRYSFRKNLKASDWHSIGYHVEKRRLQGKLSHIYLGGHPSETKKSRERDWPIQQEIGTPRSNKNELTSSPEPQRNRDTMIKISSTVEIAILSERIDSIRLQSPFTKFNSTLRGRSLTIKAVWDNLYESSVRLRQVQSYTILVEPDLSINKEIFLKHGARVNPPPVGLVVLPLFAALQFELGATKPSFALAMDCIYALLDAGSNVDIYLSHRGIGEPTSRWGWFAPGSPLWLIDYTWTHFPSLVSLLTKFSEKSVKMQSEVTVAGVCLAAYQGYENLRQYLASRWLPNGEDRPAVLQIAISEAAARGLSGPTDTIHRASIRQSERLIVNTIILYKAEPTTDNLSGAESFRSMTTALSLVKSFYPEIKADGREMVKLLVARGYRVHSKLAYDYDHLFLSSSSSTTETRRPNSPSRSSMLGDAFASHSDDRLAIVNFLLEQVTGTENVREHHTLLESVFSARKRPTLLKTLECSTNKHYDIETPVFGFTPLLKALSAGRLAVAKRLLDQGVKVNHPAYAGRLTPLAAACSSEKMPIEFIEDIIKRGADINPPTACQDSMTALHAAVETGKLNVTTLLLKHGAKVNGSRKWPTSSYVTPLDLAVIKGRLDIVHLLRSPGRKTHAFIPSFLLPANNIERPRRQSRPQLLSSHSRSRFTSNLMKPSAPRASPHHIFFYIAVITRAEVEVHTAV